MCSRFQAAGDGPRGGLIKVMCVANHLILGHENGVVSCIIIIFCINFRQKQNWKIGICMCVCYYFCEND